ncbi:MAG: hypothetical protein KC616_08770 [Myxococcales bacterium]|nr:hypothetical protein [Myxococcales bacterium]
MWHRPLAEGEPGLGSARGAAGLETRCRRAYFRVSGWLPIRLSPIAPGSIDAAIFDLSMPDPLLQPIVDAEGEADSPLMARLRRIEEKLDLLLGVASVEVPRPLGGSDRRPVVFSGSGLSLDVSFSFRRHDAFKVEILLPPPYCRLVRAVGAAVDDAPDRVGARPPFALPLAFRHIETEDRDALVAYSYDLQRFELRARNGTEANGDV